MLLIAMVYFLPSEKETELLKGKGEIRELDKELKTLEDEVKGAQPDFEAAYHKDIEVQCLTYLR